MFNHFLRLSRGKPELVAMRPNASFKGKYIYKKTISNRMDRCTDEYVISGRSQHSFEGQSSSTNSLHFSQGVAKQVDKIKPAGR